MLVLADIADKELWKVLVLCDVDEEKLWRERNGNLVSFYKFEDKINELPIAACLVATDLRELQSAPVKACTYAVLGQRRKNGECSHVRSSLCQ